MRKLAFLASLALLWVAPLRADDIGFADAKLWPALKESFFAGKTLEHADFIRIEGPKRAESGAQVPITLTVERAPNAADAIRKIYVIVDANPIPLAATYHFMPDSGRAQIATRIRLEIDSYIHAIGETADGKFYVASTVIRASGGCGGLVDGDDTAIRATAGKIKLSTDTPVAFGAPNAATFLIKHPMFTGLQRDLASGGFKPAFYIHKVEFSYAGKPVLRADFGVGVAEDPYLRFFYLPEAAGKLEVRAEDNEGKFFTQAVEIPPVNTE